MSYHAGIGPGMARLGLTPMEPHVQCDGCERAIHVLPVGTCAPPAWFLDGNPPPRWRGLRAHDGSRRWDLCPACWKGED